MTNPIDNTEDIIDSRDVIERITELEGMDDRDRVEDDELSALTDLAQEGEQYTENWKYGEALIRDSYFKEYAQDLADDIGAIDRNATWPLCHIDWEAAADSLKMDYTAVDFDGVTYWVR